MNINPNSGTSTFECIHLMSEHKHIIYIMIIAYIYILSTFKSQLKGISRRIINLEQ